MSATVEVRLKAAASAGAGGAVDAPASASTSTSSKLEMLRAIIGEECDDATLRHLLREAHYKVQSAVNKFYSTSATAVVSSDGSGGSVNLKAKNTRSRSKKTSKRSKPLQQSVISILSDDDDDFENDRGLQVVDLLSELSKDALEDGILHSKKKSKRGSRVVDGKRKVFDLSTKPAASAASSAWAQRVKARRKTRKAQQPPHHDNQSKAATAEGTFGDAEDDELGFDYSENHISPNSVTSGATSSSTSRSRSHHDLGPPRWARLGRRLIEGASLTRGRSRFKVGDRFVVWPDHVGVEDPSTTWANQKSNGGKKKSAKFGRSGSGSTSSSLSASARRRKAQDFVRFGLVRGQALGRLDTGPAPSLAYLLNAKLIRVSAEAYNCPATLWMLTPIHVLLTVHVCESALDQLEDRRGCPEPLRMAMFELMAFFFPKVNVFRNIKESSDAVSYTHLTLPTIYSV